MIDEKKLIEEVIPILNEHGDMYLAGRILGMIDCQPKTDWIPCEERLPDKTMLCLCTVEGKWSLNPIIMWWIGTEDEQVNLFNEKNGHWKEQCYKVIAWQPLPQPYKKEGNSNGNTNES